MIRASVWYMAKEMLIYSIGNAMSSELKENLSQQSTWMRGLYMLLFALFYSIAELVFFAVVLFQFLLNLFTGNSNPRLLKLGQGIATYVYQIMQYLSYNSDYQPYPFGAWPNGEPKTGKRKNEVAANGNESIEQETNVDGD